MIFLFWKKKYWFNVYVINWDLVFFIRNLLWFMIKSWGIWFIDMFIFFLIVCCEIVVGCKVIFGLGICVFFSYV